MNTIFKKLISGVLAVLMVFTCLPVAALALRVSIRPWWLFCHLCYNRYQICKSFIRLDVATKKFTKTIKTGSVSTNWLRDIIYPKKASNELSDRRNRMRTDMRSSHFSFSLFTNSFPINFFRKRLQNCRGQIKNIRLTSAAAVAKPFSQSLQLLRRIMSGLYRTHRHTMHAGKTFCRIRPTDVL